MTHTLNHPWSDDEATKLKRQGYRVYSHAVDHDLSAYLASNYQKFKSQKDWRMYNLYGTTRFETKNDPVVNQYVDRMKEEMGYEECSHYMLSYDEGSYTKMHPDPTGCLTFITLIDVLPNTIGGDTIVHVDDYVPSTLHDEKHITQGVYDSVSKKRNIIMPNQVPTIVPCERFQTMVYPPERSHGVTKVEKGRRVVFVQWFFKTKAERASTYN